MRMEIEGDPGAMRLCKIVEDDGEILAFGTGSTAKHAVAYCMSSLTDRHDFTKTMMENATRAMYDTLVSGKY